MATTNWNDLPHCQTPCVRHQIANVGDSLWISTDYNEGEKGMVEYSTKTNKIIQIVKYPKSIKPLGHSLCQHENILRDSVIIYVLHIIGQFVDLHVNNFEKIFKTIFFCSFYIE